MNECLFFPLSFPITIKGIYIYIPVADDNDQSKLA